MRRWLVTGCSSGLGWDLAHRLAAAGEQVLATARRPEVLAGLAARPNVATAALDVRDPDQCAAAVAAAVDRFGGIDVLVHNAGYGQFGAVEEVSDNELDSQFDTNVYGPWRLTRQALPVLRRQGSGHVLFVSSIAGFMPFPGLAAYTASKFALEGMAESLAAEVGQFGVKVTIVQPGGFVTAYGDKLRQPAAMIGDYQPVIGGMLTALRGLGDSPIANQPGLFSEVVRRLVAMDDPPLRLPIGEDAQKYLSGAFAARSREFEGVIAARAHLIDID